MIAPPENYRSSRAQLKNSCHEAASGRGTPPNHYGCEARITIGSEARVAIGGADSGRGRRLGGLESLEARAQAGVLDVDDRAAAGRRRRRTGRRSYGSDDQGGKSGKRNGAERGHGGSPAGRFCYG